jgi:hypothetical protein
MTSGPVGRSRPRFRPVAASHFRSRPGTAGPGLFCHRSGRLRFVRFICISVTAHGQDGRIFHGCGQFLYPVGPSRLTARTVEFVTAASGCGQFLYPVGPSRLTARTRGRSSNIAQRILFDYPNDYHGYA